jgi:hypothetical protein
MSGILWAEDVLPQQLAGRCSMSDSKRPGAASSDADSESGTPGESRRRSLFALDAMLKRGLISREEYETRRRAIDSAEGGT